MKLLTSPAVMAGAAPAKAGDEPPEEALTVGVAKVAAVKSSRICSVLASVSSARRSGARTAANTAAALRAGAVLPGDSAVATGAAAAYSAFGVTNAASATGAIRYRAGWGVGAGGAGWPVL